MQQELTWAFDMDVVASHYWSLLSCIGCLAGNGLIGHIGSYSTCYVWHGALGLALHGAWNA